MLRIQTTEFNNWNEMHKLLEWRTFLKLSQEDIDILIYINIKEMALMIFKLSIKKNLDADEFPTEF